MNQNDEYGLVTFRTSAFGGFRKNDVLEYLDSLTEKMEQLRKDKTDLENELLDKGTQLKQEKRRVDKMEELLKEAEQERTETEALLDELDSRNEEYDKLKAELEQLRKEKEEYAAFKEELEQLRQEKGSLEKALADAESSEAKEHYDALCKELEESIASYEKQKAVVSDVMLDAKVEAEHILAEADSRANYILRQADHQAELKKQTAEAMVQRFASQNIGQLNFVIQHLQEYLDMLSKVYQGVDKARRGLSQSVVGIPQELEVLQKMVKGDVVVEGNSYNRGDISL
ncbi:MAG: hypothetical protein NC400_02935 [Clostridium sp.]|nr:hypothetical protein [Clostridium sp.]